MLHIWCVLQVWSMRCGRDFRPRKPEPLSKCPGCFCPKGDIVQCLVQRRSNHTTKRAQSIARALERTKGIRIGEQDNGSRRCFTVMRVDVQSLPGVGRIPAHRTSAAKWFVRNGVSVDILENDGRKPQAVTLSDLPAPERLACLERSIATLGLPLGTYDDAAHEAFIQAPASMRENAERKAAMVRVWCRWGSVSDGRNV